MIRVQLSAGLVVLLVLSYSAVEREARAIVDRAVGELAQSRARQALALGRAEWTENVERQRALTRDAAGRLAEGPGAVVTALSRQLGGARAFVLDRDRKVVAESGETASAPPSTLPGLAELRPGTSIVRLSASAKTLIVAAATAPDGRVVGTVRQLHSAELGAWLGGVGEGALQLGVVGADGRVRGFSAGEVEATLGSEAVVSLKSALYRVARAELYDDVGESIELAGFGRVDQEPGLQIAAFLRTTWYALGAAALLIILVVVPMVQRLRSKERAMEGFLGDEEDESALPARAAAGAGASSLADEEDTDTGWSEVAQVKASEPPLRPEDLVSGEISQTLPPPAGEMTVGAAPRVQTSVTTPSSIPEGAGSVTMAPSGFGGSTGFGAPMGAAAPVVAKAAAAVDAALGAYLPNDPTPPGGFGSSRPASFAGGGLGGFAPTPLGGEARLPVPEPEGPPAAAYDPYSYGQVPEFASEIHPFHDPLRPEPTRGHGSSPPPRPFGGAPFGHDLARPAGGFGSSIPAAAAPITRGPNIRASAPPPGLEDARPFDLEHYRVVYTEFVENKRRLGEAVDNVTLEGFTAKLRKSEQDLIERHGCRAVRFQVLVRNRQVSLRPQLVR